MHNNWTFVDVFTISHGFSAHARDECFLKTVSIAMGQDKGPRAPEDDMTFIL